MWGLIVVHSEQVFRFNCVRFSEVPLYNAFILHIKLYSYTQQAMEICM